MAYTLQNDRLSIRIQPTGAELASLVDRKTGREHIWQADPAVWGSHAPVLFPIIGALKNGEMTHRGQTYRIPKHGLIRHNDRLEPFSVQADRITLRLCSSEETRRHYPFDFDFRITFRLRNEHLIVYHEVTNTGTEPLYFNLGGHPAFRVPCFPDDAYDDYRLRFEHPEASESYTVTAEGTIGPTTRQVPWGEHGSVLPLTHELFAEDALVFKDLVSRSVILESANHGPVLKLDYAGWTHLGVWAKPTGDFVCIEPWIGLADPHDASGEFTDKEGLVELAPNETYEMSYDIKILG